MYKNIKYAANGIISFIISERSARFELVAIATLILLGFIFKISTLEWIAQIVCSCIVITLEAINTSIEKLCNFFHPNHNTEIGTIKDIAAGAVLLGSLFSIVVAICIYIPKITFI